MRDCCVSFCLVSALLVIFLGACGKRPSLPPPVSGDTSSVAIASQAVFEERDETGAVAWRLKAESVKEESGVIIGQGLILENLPDEFQESGSNHSAQDHLTVAGNIGAFEAAAARGAIWRESSVSVVRLEDGFSMKMENGWSVEGSAVTWNGTIMKAETSVSVSRPGTLIHGQNAMIDPKKNRFILRKVSGVISGMSL